MIWGAKVCHTNTCVHERDCGPPAKNNLCFVEHHTLEQSQAGVFVSRVTGADIVYLHDHDRVSSNRGWWAFLCCALLVCRLLYPLGFRALLYFDAGRQACPTRVGPHCACSGGFAGSRWVCLDARYLPISYADDQTRRGATAGGMGKDVDRPRR